MSDHATLSTDTSLGGPARPWRVRLRELSSAPAFRRAQSNGLWMLRRLDFDPALVLGGYERWQDLVGRMSGTDPEVEVLLYGATRGLRPAVTIETGTTAGPACSAICAALVDNGVGEMVSIPGSGSDDAADVPHEIARRLGPRHRVVTNDGQRVLERILAGGAVDCVVVHGDESDARRRARYDLAWSALRAGGLLVTSDVGPAWREFGRSVRRRLDTELNVNRYGALRKAP